VALLLSILFDVVADMLATMTEHAKLDDQIKGEFPHLVDGGLSILQSMDDTIFLYGS
jgi:hypothetical protein